MRFSTSSCLLSKHNVLLSRLWNTSVGVRVPSRASSLSAIHRGLRNSERARPQGFNKESLSPRHPSRSSRNPPPDFKIKKGKKDITWTGPKPKSRSKRFNDPTEPFGKKSLVYQMKQERFEGNKDRLSPDQFLQSFKGLSGPDERGSRRPDRDSRGRGKVFDRDTRSSSSGPSRDRAPPKFTERSSQGRFSERSGESKFTERPDRGRFDKQSGRDEFSERPNQSRFSKRPDQEFRGRPSQGRFSDQSDQGRFSKRPDQNGFARRSDKDRFSEQSGQDRPARQSGEGKFAERPGYDRFAKRPSQERFADKEDRRPERDSSETNHRERGGGMEGGYNSTRRDDSYIRVQRTTAASQFLYGRSVVEAALRDSRRQLYKLYIYNGEDRSNVAQDELLERLAQRKGVPVTKVESGNLRLMEKMSEGRPHNGYVLEASPLPQLPLKSLGPVSEDPKKAGFSVDIAYQSAEEAQVNGTSDFVSCHLPEGRNPFVLLLDGILDPGNLGAILRSAAFLGVDAVAITKTNSATLTPVALKASAGASEAMTLFSVSSTVSFLSLSRDAGWIVYAAVPATTRSRGNTHLTLNRLEAYDPLATQPTILVVGSEGEGLTKPVRRQADFEVCIPSNSGLLSVVDSLNVSVATGILCSSFLKNQTSKTLEIEEEHTEESEESEESEGSEGSEESGGSRLW
ncbi:hypothetical protein F5X96DRAFT_661652 [Biscogniauxia mediterranea]|nr:hypothetical protein F5X96DRAFT_661652 [Biscogniauxia mediterranea]